MSQVWRKYGFVLLWAAVGLDLIFSVLGNPFLGQAISAIFVIMYLFDHVSMIKYLYFIAKLFYLFVTVTLPRNSRTGEPT